MRHDGVGPSAQLHLHLSCLESAARTPEGVRLQNELPLRVDPIFLGQSLVKLPPVGNSLVSLLLHDFGEVVGRVENFKQRADGDDIHMVEICLRLGLLAAFLWLDCLGLESRSAPVAVASVVQALTVSLPDGIEAA